MNDGMVGSKQGKPGQQGSTTPVGQIIGSLASRLTLVIGIACVCSCAYFILLIVSSHPCWMSSSSYCESSGFSSRSDATPVDGEWRDPLLSVHPVRVVNETSVPELNSIHGGRRPTSIDRIVFGIGASADLWMDRKKFLNLWWTRGKTRGFVWTDRDLGDAWTEFDPPYKVSEDTSQFKYTHKTGSRAALRISRIVSETFRLGLSDVDWFVMGDDDTFYFTDNLVRVLSKYDHRQLWYIGSSSEDHIQNQQFSYNMAYGGGGFAISYALAKVLSEKQDACIQRYPWLFGSDDRMKACMSELGVPLTKELGFHQLDVRGDVGGLLAAHPITPIVSLHHLEAIYPVFPNYTRVEALAHLMKAVKLSPLNVFQQSICYDEGKQWSFSLSWGYVVHVYRGYLAPNVLEVPILTFLSWHRRRESYAFPMNTRSRSREICDEPSSFFLKDAKPSSDGLTQTSYKNGDRLNRIRVCQQKLLPMSRVREIFVESESLGEQWLENPRRQCCRVTDVKPESVSLAVGVCKDGEALFS